jgi:hypothetical protein
MSDEKKPESALVGLLRQRPRSVAPVLLSFALVTEAAASSLSGRPRSRFEHCLPTNCLLH